MAYSYDVSGWYSPIAIPGRETSIAPPETGKAPVVGEDWPNFTGHKWVLQPYVLPPEPVPEPVPELTPADEVAALGQLAQAFVSKEHEYAASKGRGHRPPNRYDRDVNVPVDDFGEYRNAQIKPRG